MKNRLYVAGLAICLSFAVQSTSAQEPEDHSLLGRYPGAVNENHPRSIEFDVIELPAAPMGEEEPEQVLELEGRIRWDAYRGPEGATEIAIGRSYEKSLSDGGFDILFSCVGDECGDLLPVLHSHSFRDLGGAVSGSPGWAHYARYNDRSRYYLAKRENEDNTAYVLLYISRYKNNSTQMNIGQIIVESADMEIEEIEVGVLEAKELQEALETDGKVAVPGIFFELDSDKLQNESAEALEQMAALMSGTDYQVLIAGHTDNQGSHNYNMDLSSRRAQAVRQVLVNDYNIDGSRMAAEGFGFTEPVASNDTEEGQAQNRRVELILKNL